MGAVDYYWTTKLWCLNPKIRKMMSGQSTWTLRSSSNPLMVAGRVGGQVNAVNAGQGFLSNISEQIQKSSDHVPYHFFASGFPLSCNLTLLTLFVGRLSADCRHCCSLKLSQSAIGKVPYGSILSGPFVGIWVSPNRSVSLLSTYLHIKLIGIFMMDPTIHPFMGQFMFFTGFNPPSINPFGRPWVFPPYPPGPRLTKFCDWFVRELPEPSSQETMGHLSNHVCHQVWVRRHKKTALNYYSEAASACLSVVWQTWPRSRSPLLPKNWEVFAKLKKTKTQKLSRRTIKNTRWKKKMKRQHMNERVLDSNDHNPEQHVSIHVTWLSWAFTNFTPA